MGGNAVPGRQQGGPVWLCCAEWNTRCWSRPSLDVSHHCPRGSDGICFLYFSFLKSWHLSEIWLAQIQLCCVKYQRDITSKEHKSQHANCVTLSGTSLCLEVSQDHRLTTSFAYPSAPIRVAVGNHHWWHTAVKLNPHRGRFGGAATMPHLLQTIKSQASKAAVPQYGS